jgi:hypothetical protein
MAGKFERKDDGNNRVTFDKKALSSVNKKRVELRTAEVEVPELNELMGARDGQITVMVVRQMRFDELLETQQEQFDAVRNVIEGILEAAADKNAVKEEVAAALSGKSAAFSKRIDVIERCLVKPKLTRQDIIYIAKMFPSVPVKLYTRIIALTDQGADIKKNSID